MSQATAKETLLLARAIGIYAWRRRELRNALLAAMANTQFLQKQEVVQWQ
jgi:hypothetical protein